MDVTVGATLVEGLSSCLPADIASDRGGTSWPVPVSLANIAVRPSNPRAGSEHRVLFRSVPDGFGALITLGKRRGSNSTAKLPKPLTSSEIGCPCPRCILMSSGRNHEPYRCKAGVCSRGAFANGAHVHRFCRTREQKCGTASAAGRSQRCMSTSQVTAAASTRISDPWQGDLLKTEISSPAFSPGAIGSHVMSYTLFELDVRLREIEPPIW